MKEELIPSWSHDGKRLAVLQWGHGRTSIALYNPDGSDRTPLFLPGNIDDAMLQRIRAYVSRHYPRAVRRDGAARQAVTGN